MKPHTPMRTCSLLSSTLSKRVPSYRNLGRKTYHLRCPLALPSYKTSITCSYLRTTSFPTRHLGSPIPNIPHFTSKMTRYRVSISNIQTYSIPFSSFFRSTAFYQYIITLFSSNFILVAYLGFVVRALRDHFTSHRHHLFPAVD